MSRDILIVGQGVAGTLLGAALERAGLPFAMADHGHAHAASRVAAGMVNPLTGPRFVPSWEIGRALPRARETYLRLGGEWGVTLWRDMRVRRCFASDDERRTFADKRLRGALAPFVTEADDDGFWIERAGWVDFPVLLATARRRWRGAGRLVENTVDWASPGAFRWVIDCSGAGDGGDFGFVPWQYGKGEVLTLAVEGLDPSVILNDGRWVLPVGARQAKVGATHEPGRRDHELTAAARATLVEAAARLLDRPFAVVDHVAGVRVNVPDRRPVAGVHPSRPGRGILGGLGAKGALYAPWLAELWVNHLSNGAGFGAELEPARFA